MALATAQRFRALCLWNLPPHGGALSPECGYEQSTPVNRSSRHWQWGGQENGAKVLTEIDRPLDARVAHFVPFMRVVWRDPAWHVMHDNIRSSMIRSSREGFRHGW